MYKWTERVRLQNVRAQNVASTMPGGRLSRATEEEREISLNILQYRRLAQRGIIGDEHRLDWIKPGDDKDFAPPVRHPLRYRAAAPKHAGR